MPAALKVPAGRPAGLKPGRNATINDIARLASVSKKTVSRVINQSPLVQEETRARIQAVIDKFGYVPDPQARGLAFRKSFLIGLVYDNPNAQYIVNLMEGVLEAVRNTEYEVVVHPCDRKKPDFIAGVRRFVERQKLRGAILLPPISENDELTRALSAADCAYVRITYTVARRAGAHRDLQRSAGSLGSRKLPGIPGTQAHRLHRGPAGLSLRRGAARGIPRSTRARARYRFRKNSSSRAGTPTRAASPVAKSCWRSTRAPAPFSRAMTRWPRVSIAWRTGWGLSIPGDLSIVGFDDGPLASRLLPSLTTIRLPIRELGRIAANKILHPEAAGGTHAMVTPLEPHLVIRDSCQPPRPVDMYAAASAGISVVARERLAMGA